MTTAPVPLNEARRISVLRSLDVLDTGSEERFDRLTRLAQKLFNVAAAAVDLLDADRQWVKSSSGRLDGDMPRSQSFCAHAIVSDDIMVVPDTAQDRRFRDNPLVAGRGGVRFYAGCPLKVADGVNVGTLSLYDDKPRELEAQELALLGDLARLVERELTVQQCETVDRLTQLSTRRGFLSLGDRALASCTRHEWPATLLFLVLDEFAGIDERSGQAQAARALEAFADILRTTVRQSDVIGRLEGNQFVVLLVDATSEDSEALIERLDQMVMAQGRSQGAGHALRFRVGAVDFDPDRHRSLADMLVEGEHRMNGSTRRGN
ncbi:diguanylate cyclase domain-containing protein [Cupriavidus sp. AU9028]|uniref:sensor domain-containing diguanylate cyclase n=1 Tax=Cupriavidus sp. AU9028 TaxID=2871157 RepID=UPI001C970FF8|nr:diguanylate cyclase [Cupriavidus sp. AU9028]MBY4895891.1 diguanylate cyclase [Cupriavidus sp. AU9028]